MMIFIPRSSNESACDAIQDYRDARPEAPNRLYNAVSFGLFVISVLLWSVSIVLFIVFRNRERLRVVRPLFLNLLLCIAQILFASGLTLNLVALIRCGALLVCIQIGFAGIAINYFLRLLVFVIESQFALSMAEQHRQQYVIDDKASVATSHQSRARSYVSSSVSNIASLFTVFRLALGLKSIGDVSFEELFKASHSFYLLAFTVLLPPFVIAIGILIAERTYYSGCFGCSIFLEVVIGFALTLAIFSLLSARIMYVAWQLKFSDHQGLFREFVQVLLLVCPVMFIGTLLLLFDPASASYTRKFAYEWIIHIGTFIHWYISAGAQFRAILSEKRVPKPKKSITPVIIDDYLAVLHNDLSVQDAFERFAVSRYCAENLYFVNDVVTYKRFFFEKGANWRKQKALFLFNTYIKLGSVMEVNISQQVKMQIIHEVESRLDADDNQLVSVFDKAKEDITNNVLRDIWQQFILREKDAASVTKGNGGCCSCLLPAHDERFILAANDRQVKVASNLARSMSSRPKAASNLSTTLAVTDGGRMSDLT